ncbi:MAG: hypothetical protein MUF48_24830 [Pirellulaceae bacterium]|nr:hypothetical protein [Pirellulaceae bacterium]
MQWARGPRKRFFEVVVFRAMTASNRGDEDKQRGDEHDHKTVKQMRGIRANQQMTHALGKDIAAFPARKWTCCHGVVLTDQQHDDTTRRPASVVENHLAAVGSSAHAQPMPPMTSSATVPPIFPRTSWFS